MCAGFGRFQVATGRAAGMGLLLDAARTRQNRREYIVEIVGDAARQGTDGLDFLHLHEVAVQLLGLHGAGNDVGDGQHLRGEGRRDVARVAVEDTMRPTSSLR